MSTCIYAALTVDHFKSLPGLITKHALHLANAIMDVLHRIGSNRSIEGLLEHLTTDASTQDPNSSLCVSHNAHSPTELSILHTPSPCLGLSSCLGILLPGLLVLVQANKL